MAESLVVTIDGPAGVGKSTMAKRLATELGVPYLDTGAMFRALAWKLGEGAWDWPAERLSAALDGVGFHLSGVGADAVLSMDGAAVGQEIRTEQVGMWASNVARLPVVREHLKRAQREVGRAGSLVAEGRDMGTVVFPDAACKFFLDADPAERALRRMRQLQAMGREADLAELEAAIRARDDQDRNRAVAPLRPADDAVVVDTTSLNRDQVFAELVRSVRNIKKA